MITYGMPEENPRYAREDRYESLVRAYRTRTGDPPPEDLPLEELEALVYDLMNPVNPD